MSPSTLFAMGAVALVIGGMFVVFAWLGRRGQLRPESTRKAAHIAVGLCAVSFGWLFDESMPVVILSLGGLVFAVAVRFVPILHRTIGPVVHAVSRRSFGDYCIPIAVPILHALAMPEREFFVIPMLVLTLADSAAALVGKRFGRWTYRTDEGTKTLEGSAALGAVAAVIVFGSLLLWDYELPRAAAIAVLVSVLVMLAEAVSWRGMDNLILPLGSFALLRIYTDMPSEMIVLRVVVSVVVTIFVLFWHRRAGLIGAAGVASACTVYACWAIGGIVWAVPPLVILVCLPYFGARRIDGPDDDLGVGVILSMSAVPLAWLFLQDSVVLRSSLVPFLASWSGVLGVSWIVRRNRDRALGEKDAALSFKVFTVVVLVGAASWILPGGVSEPGQPMMVMLLAFGLAAFLESVANLDNRPLVDETRWTVRAFIVLLSSVSGFAPLIISAGSSAS